MIGKQIYPNAEFYEGEWKNDLKDGDGKIALDELGMYKYSNGDIYQGNWISDRRNGKGNNNNKY